MPWMYAPPAALSFRLYASCYFVTIVIYNIFLMRLLRRIIVELEILVGNTISLVLAPVPSQHRQPMRLSQTLLE